MTTFTKPQAVDIHARFPQFKFAKSFQRIQLLLNTEHSVSGLLNEIETEIKHRLETNHADPGYTPAQALFDILRESEDAGGFNVKQVKYVSGVLKPDTFRAMMTGAFAFLDPFVTNRHGAETHRIQWWMIGRDMAANPNEYDAQVQPAQLFAATNDAQAIHTDTDNVWYHCLDAQQGACDTACAPESLKEYFMAKFPNLAQAETAQMNWNDCAKARYVNIKGQGPVARAKAQELVRYPEGT